MSYAPIFGKKEAIDSLYPLAEYLVKDDGIEWLSTDISEPTNEEIQLEIDKLQAAWDDKQYSRDRDGKYPLIEDQLDMLYHDIKNGTLESGEWITAIEAVKDKYPKGS